MARIKAIYGKQLLEKTYKTFPFEGEWARALGNPEVAGFWLVYGREKQGKTWFSLLLAEYLSNYERRVHRPQVPPMDAQIQKHSLCHHLTRRERRTRPRCRSPL